MNPSRNKIKISTLSETATDQEIQEAWESLCAFQKRLQEKQKKVARRSEILYDKDASLKKTLFSPKIDIEGLSEAAGEEKSRTVMKTLSEEKGNLVSNPALLTEVDRWRSR